ncbi:MAG: thioredoxin fold domain-containing protein [Deltaproteobacteria bacterium]|nr:thioredoxin fold domain-containing protein [Deltaproteobacteria bacterium]
MSHIRYFIILILSLLISGFTDQSVFSDKGFLNIIIIMFIGGFLTAFTPCVYPLIPVTIGIISEINKDNKKPPLLMSLIYASGIIMTYTSLGVIAGLGSFTFGSYMGNKLFVWVLSLIFFLLGLSMAGFYEFKLPTYITDKIVNIKGSNVVSIFIMGLVAGFVAAPCTGPILASALIFISTGGSPLLGGMYLFFYSVGLSIIFVVAGSFSGILKKLPRSGGWMIVVRSIFAVAIISYSFYLIDSIYRFSNHLNVLSSSVILIVGILIGGLTKEADFMPLKIKLQKLAGILLISLSLIGFSSEYHKEQDNINWIPDYHEGIKKAAQLKKPVIIDFYANWCAACKEIKRKTFPDKRIQKESERFVMIFVDMTNQTKETSELEKKYRITGLPAIIFLDSQQNEIEQLRVKGYVNAEEFLSRMRQVR